MSRPARTVASASPPPGHSRVTAAHSSLLLVAVLAAVALAAAPARAQAPLTLVNNETTVESVGFTFVDGQTLFVQDLEEVVATAAPPKPILFGLLGSEPRGVYRFDPIETAKDVVRLERHYADQGFPRASADYVVSLDTTENAVAVTFVIEEGPPLIVDEVTFAGPGQSDVADALAPELREDWIEFQREPVVGTGDRLDQFALVQLQNQTIAWLGNRGYAWADAGAEVFPDSTGLVADVRVKALPGVRARFGEITVQGAESLDEATVLRELPFEPGDRFNASALADAQREVFGLGLFTLALVDIAPEAVRGDTVVPVLVRLQRGPSRVLELFGGYFGDGGLTVRGAATHRNAFGAARQVSLEGEARTGLLSDVLPAFLAGGGDQSVGGGPITDYRVSLPIRQPYVLDRRLSYTLQPSYRKRNDEIEASETFEVANTLLYSVAPLKTAALSVTGRTRDLSQGLGIRILDAGQFRLPPGPFLPDTLRATTGVVGLDVVWGTLDDPIQPTRGFVLRPSASVAGGDVAYARGRLAGSATVPMSGRRTLVVRGTVGALAALGGTSPDALSDYVLFRDQLFYAGGTSDVRGWAAARLGPKTFSVTPPLEDGAPPDEIPDPSLLSSRRDVNYVGVGGQAKVSASVQLNLPLRALGPQWGWSVFADAGGVFAPSEVPQQDLLRAGGAPADSVLADILDGEGGLRVGVGAGLQYLTPVGAVSVAAAFKVNPSYLDLRDPARVYCGDSIIDVPEGLDDPVCFSGVGVYPDDAPGYVDARLNGTDFDPDAIEERSVTGIGFLDIALRRLQLHITIGQTF